MRLRIASLFIFVIATGIILNFQTQSGSRLTPLDHRFDKEKESYAFVLPNLKPVEVIDTIQGETCAVCHRDIYDEWRASTHANALRDIQFQAELSKADSPKWLCLNCHIPVQNQRDSIVTHLRDNDVLQPVKKVNSEFIAEYQQEGISCAACHIRRDEKTGASYIIGAIGSTYAPHPVKKDPEFLRQICVRCHDPQGEQLTQNLLCWFETVDELADGQANLQKTGGKTPDCVDCHMPIKKRLLTITFPMFPVRDSHMHHWVGSGVPKQFDGYDNLLERGYISGLETMVNLPQSWLPGSDLKFSIMLKNARSGHDLPTADPERFLLVKVVLSDKNGACLQERQLRIGQEWLWNPARKVGDNRLKQGETRVWPVQLPLPQKLAGNRLSVFVLHVRLSSKNAKYMMQAKNIDESFLPNGRELIANATEHYPFASFIFREDIDLTGGRRKLFSPEELVALSKKEKGKALSQRDY